MKYKEKTYEHLLFCGDIHGDINVIPNFLKKNELKNCAVFQVGDFGIGFQNDHDENRRMFYLSDRMENSNSDLFVIRGNHDNPKYFDGEHNYDNLFFIEDYSVIEINGKNILGVGGAISIDRTNRSGYWNKYKTHNYWKDEIFVLDEEKLKKIKDIDIVITHTSPNFCVPLTKIGLKSWLLKDKELDNDTTMERHFLTIMYNILIENNKIQEWYYGHFHLSNIQYYEDIKFLALDIDEIISSKVIYEE